MGQSSAKPLRLATRRSQLARWQADWVASQLRDLGHAVQTIEVITSGDSHSATPIADLGATGVFTKEIQSAVLAGVADIAVHSMKDLPTEQVEGLTLAAVPARERPWDVLVTASSRPAIGGLSELPNNALVGTSSLRRQAFMRNARPDLRLVEVRGNVDTRLRKLDNGEFDALVLAKAGLSRLGFADRSAAELMPPVMLPAVGQGALAIECRSADDATRLILTRLDDADTRASVMAERSLLAHLRGGCLAPIGAWGRLLSKTTLHLSASVLSIDGRRRLDVYHTRPYSKQEDAERLGQIAADDLLTRGAAEMIAASRDRG
jgi:hydroxymethylbilane synthase